MFTRPSTALAADATGRRDLGSRMVAFRVTLHLTDVAASVTVSVPQGSFVGHLRQAVADAANAVANEIDLYIYSIGDKAANGIPPGILLDSDTKYDCCIAVGLAGSLGPVRSVGVAPWARCVSSASPDGMLTRGECHHNDSCEM